MNMARAAAPTLLAASVLALFFLFLPVPAQAQTDENISIWPTGYWGDPETGLISCRPQGIVVRDPTTGEPKQNEVGIPEVIPNTACNICHVFLTAKRLIYFGLSFLVFILVPGTLVYAGFVMLTAGGNAEKSGQATKVFTGTAWGLAFGLGGFLIVNTFFAFITPVVGGKEFKLSWWNIDCADLQQYNFGQYEYQQPGE